MNLNLLKDHCLQAQFFQRNIFIIITVVEVDARFVLLIHLVGNIEDGRSIACQVKFDSILPVDQVLNGFFFDHHSMVIYLFLLDIFYDQINYQAKHTICVISLNKKKLSFVQDNVNSDYHCLNVKLLCQQLHETNTFLLSTSLIHDSVLALQLFLDIRSQTFSNILEKIVYLVLLYFFDVFNLKLPVNNVVHTRFLRLVKITAIQKHLLEDSLVNTFDEFVDLGGKTGELLITLKLNFFLEMSFSQNWRFCSSNFSSFADEVH